MPPRNDLVWRRLVELARLMAVGWAAAILFHHVMGAVLGLPYPWNTFLFDPADRFGDLANSWREARTFDPYGPHGVPGMAAYFPLVYAGLLVLSRASRTWVVAVYLLAALGAALAIGLAWILRERPRWIGDSRWPVASALVLAISVGNYPLLMALDRGNFDPLITVLLAGSVVSLYRGRPILGGMLLGISAAAKGYPVAAALLWIRRRCIPGAITAVATLAALVILPGLVFKGGIGETLRGLAAGVAEFRRLHVFGDCSAHYCADGLNAIRVAIMACGIVPDMGRIVPVYEAVAFLWAGLLAVDALLLARGAWRESLALVLVMLVFPDVTNDYKLVLLVPVVLAWLSSEEAGWRDRVFSVCAALLFVPKHYGVIIPGYDASVSCLVSPFLLVGLTSVLWPTAQELSEGRERLIRARSAALRLLRARPRAGASLGERG